MSGTLYFECYSGISGDMAVAAMIDLGADRGALMRAMDSLDMGGFRIEVSRKTKSGLDVCDFDVILDEDNHDHDSEYLYGSGHHEHHGHCHRGLAEIDAIISKADVTDRAKDYARRIFRVLAEAESKAHGVPVEEVHFHEVGAVDSIADIVALGVCLDSLDVSEVCFSELYEGIGMVRCQHGILPIPVPAVANIVSAHSIPIRITESKGEYVTPTGAAFAAAVRTRDPPESFVIRRTGMGGGKRESERSGILRAMIIEPRAAGDTIVKLECNVDDCTGEFLGYAAERLMREGARDAHYVPIIMKKGRPAYLLSVICRESERPLMERIIFEETSTVGIRRVVMDRTVMDRRFEDIETSIGTVTVKFCTIGGIEKPHPEYESLSGVCRQKGIPYREAYDIVMAELRHRR